MDFDMSPIQKETSGLLLEYGHIFTLVFQHSQSWFLTRGNTRRIISGDK
jgi:hypothetical protein